MFNRKDITGKKFGRLIAVKIHEIIRQKNRTNTLWLCKCDCGNKKIVSISSLNRGATSSCGCLQKESLKVNGKKIGGYNKDSTVKDKICIICKKKFSPYRKTDITCSKICRKEKFRLDTKERRYPSQKHEFRRNDMAKKREEDPATYLFYNIRHRDKKTNLTKDWIQKKYDNGKCEVSGINFHKRKYKEGSAGFAKSPWGLTIDRIDPSKNYLKSNCEAVVWIYNQAKQSYSKKIVFEFFKKLVETRKTRRKSLNLIDKLKELKFDTNIHPTTKWRILNPHQSILDKIKQRDKSTNIDSKWLFEKINNGYCEQTGIKFDLNFKTGKKHIRINPYYPSIDRKNNNLKYSKNNCQVVLTIYNVGKHRFKDSEFKRLSKEVVRYNKL